MKVAEIMTRDPETVSPKDSLKRAAQLMDDLDIGVLPVCDGARLVGVVTDRDITVRATSAGAAPADAAVADAMTDEVRWCFEDEEVEAAEQLMRALQVRRIPIVDRDKNLTGVLALGDIATAGANGADETLDRISRPSQPDR